MSDFYIHFRNILIEKYKYENVFIDGYEILTYKTFFCNNFS